jgi:8-oxo-dGTP pyrophosphatase MutT (NUDIX family)
MRQPLYYASVYGIIRNDKWEILVAQRWEKANGFQWRYELPAGHMDGKETVFEALQKEMREELRTK